MLKFFILITLLYCIVGYAQTLSPVLESQMMTQFAILDDPSSSELSVSKAFQQILAMGKPALPLIQKQFKQTQNPRYLYLIQKLNAVNDDLKTNTSTYIRQNEQAKLEYFQQRLQDAHRLLNDGQIKPANDLAQAILVLEPNLPFRKEVLELIKVCKEAEIQQEIISGIMESPVQFYSPDKDIQIRLGFHNHKQIPIALVAGNQNGIVLDVIEQEFAYNGEYRERSFNFTYNLSDTMILPIGIQWLPMITIPVHKSSTDSYHRFTITAYIPRIRVEVEKKTLYPNIQFPKLKVHSLPSRWHFVIRDPVLSARQALAKQNDIILFYSSFFWNEQQKKQIIPALIAQWPGNTLAMKRTLPTVLKLTTGQHFLSKIEWQNWWTSQNQ